ncbi:hypothetical protein SUGI_0459520 [Cryptomeria japonica]|nr:hypothetical protein SUGI_0459520 [Cryptomeria japonica]
MSLQSQMHRVIVVRFVICVCLVGFIAAKCVPERCGSMNVSYPFWINNSHCGFPGFQITCRKDEDTGMMVPFLHAYKGGSYDHLIWDYYKIMEIDYMGYLTVNSTSLKTRSCGISAELFQNGRYAYSTLAVGRCISLCYTPRPQIDPPYCQYGCCEINLLDNFKWINFTGGGVFSLRNSTSNVFDEFGGFSTIFDPSTFRVVDNNTNLFWGKGRKADYGLRLNWGVGLSNCSTVQGTANYSCSINAECLESPSGEGHLCRCLPGYVGNGYSNGTDCTDVDECSRIDLNMCVKPDQGGTCHNLPGSYNYSCADGYKGDGFHNGTRCASTSSNHVVFPATAGSVSSFVVVSLASFLLVWRVRKLLEDKYYQQLRDFMTSTVGKESLRIFSDEDLEKASNNFSNEKVLGKGGFGTVFKGILLDGTLVAIKKSEKPFKLEESHDFLNEVRILSQINHRNIVKLLGCCIQKHTNLPMLIAIETAEALAYLHSGASQPIFHWDIKSSNILLNETSSPKVADFGISRLITASNNTHVTNIIKGTRGYLDPEYIRTGQFNDKSDVYSFGVVLVELLTALKPFSPERATDELCLPDYFLAIINDNHKRLREILDSKVLKEENLQQMEDMARLARECLDFERRKRLSMKEVVEELLWVRGGARKKKVRVDAIFEQTSVLREASQTAYKFRSYTFPSAAEATLEEPSTALLQMSTMP